MRVNTDVSARTYNNEYVVLTKASTTHIDLGDYGNGLYIIIMRPLGGLQKGKFYLFFCEALQNRVIARH